MKRSFFAVVLCACGPAPAVNEPPTGSAPPPIDETKCQRQWLEADGRDSTLLEPLQPGQYVFATTYLRLRQSRETLELFRKLNTPIGETLQTAPGLVRVVTRLSESCNTARTFTVWRDEASMLKFVTSEAHTAAMVYTNELSRGESLTQSWSGDATDFAWNTVLKKLEVSTNRRY
jgi:hypothetical protein